MMKLGFRVVNEQCGEFQSIMYQLSNLSLSAASCIKLKAYMGLETLDTGLTVIFEV